MRREPDASPTISFLIALILLCVSSSANAEPEAQWRGKNRDGIYDEQNLLKTWPEGGPELIWSQQGIGHGWSSVVISAETLFVTGTQDTVDYLSALSKEGKLLWQIPFARTWDKSYPEARCTPTVEEGKVYLISSHGKVMLLEMKIIESWERLICGRLFLKMDHIGLILNLCLNFPTSL